MNSELMEFGNYLKYLREDYGFTLSELAEEVGYSTAYLSQIEKGRRKKRATIDMLKQLSLALETPYSELLRKAGYEELAEGQYYKELFFSIKLNKNREYLWVDKRDETNEDLKLITNLTNVNLKGVFEWTDDQRFSENETIYLREHFNELLLKYKEIIKELVNANQKWVSAKDCLIEVWGDNATEEEIKQKFLKLELDTNIYNLIKFIENLSWFMAARKEI